MYLIQLLLSCNIAICGMLYNFYFKLSSVSASILYSIRELSVHGIAVMCLHMHLQSDE